MSKLTEEQLRQTKEWHEWIGGGYVNLFVKEIAPDTFIAIQSFPNDEDELNYSITRFFAGILGKIHVSVDYDDISDVEVFEAIFQKYTNPLR